MAAGFIFSNGFQFDRIGQLAFFSSFLSLFLMVVWVVMYITAALASRLLARGNFDGHDYKMIGVVCELLFFHTYIIFAFFFHFSSIYVDFSSDSNLSVAGVGGQMIIEDGVLTLYGMQQAVSFLISSYFTAALIHLSATIFFIWRKPPTKGDKDE